MTSFVGSPKNLLQIEINLGPSNEKWLRSPTEGNFFLILLLLLKEKKRQILLGLSKLCGSV